MTERAWEMLKETLDDMVDRRNEDDEVIEHEGRAVLLLSRELSLALGGKTIDVEEVADGRGGGERCEPTSAKARPAETSA